LKKTHAELLAGRPMPLSSLEFVRWSAFFERKAELEEKAMAEAEKKAKRSGK
jgi:hypothetical protein